MIVSFIVKQKIDFLGGLNDCMSPLNYVNNLRILVDKF